MYEILTECENYSNSLEETINYFNNILDNSIENDIDLIQEYIDELESIDTLEYLHDGIESIEEELDSYEKGIVGIEEQIASNECLEKDGIPGEYIDLDKLEEYKTCLEENKEAIDKYTILYKEYEEEINTFHSRLEEIMIEKEIIIEKELMDEVNDLKEEEEEKRKREKFSKNKIKGDFAELICKHHFELMGYTMNKVGIEELSPAFANINGLNKYTEALKKRIQNMPDFLAVYPNLNYASFVEVKYRRNMNNSSLKSFSNTLHKNYKNFINDGTPLHFYLVTNIKPYVYIMKSNSKEKIETGGFYSIGDVELDKKSLFKSQKKEMGFNDVYSKVIKLAIEDIILPPT